jgi:hypothetical protein
MDFKTTIRTIPDYPKPGIMFRDVTTLMGNPRAFRRAVDEMVQPYAGVDIHKVAGIEARGFILGGAVAHQLSCGFVPVRKKGKLPFTVLGEDYGGISWRARASASSKPRPNGNPSPTGRSRATTSNSSPCPTIEVTP